MKDKCNLCYFNLYNEIVLQGPNGISILDGLSASGLRTIRFFKEIDTNLIDFI